MILRGRRGRARFSGADACPAHFRNIVVPELCGIPGFLGACLSRRQSNDSMEFLVLARWQSLEAIQQFAGYDISRSIVEAGAAGATMQHYEVIEDTTASGA